MSVREEKSNQHVEMKQKIIKYHNQLPIRALASSLGHWNHLWGRCWHPNLEGI